MKQRILYLDLVGGAAGDMLLAALLDLGASPERIIEALASMGLNDIELRIREVHPESLRALQLDVMVRGELADALTIEGTPTIHTPDRMDLREGKIEAPSSEVDPTRSDPSVEVRSGDTHSSGGSGHAHTHTHHTHTHHTHDHNSNGSGHTHTHHIHAHSSNGSGHTHADGSGHGHRPWRVIRDLIDTGRMSDRARRVAQDAFRRLAKAESLAHGVPMEEVEFHEVGSDDAIVDIVGTAIALDELGVDEVVSSPLPLGRGLSRGAHGALPIPGPATLHILEGAPLAETPLQSETVTPTGAALVRAMARRFGPIPSMVLISVGVGAGHKHWHDRPNIVRAILGSNSESTESIDPVQPTKSIRSVREPSHDVAVETDHRAILQLETNIDDMSPEHLRLLFTELFAAGALDVWATSCMFKKGRLGWVVSMLSAEIAREDVLAVLFTHSSTLGVRWWNADRHVIRRTMETVSTRFGEIRVKRSCRPRGSDGVKPEHDDVFEAASTHKVSMREVEEEVWKQLWSEKER